MKRRQLFKYAMATSAAGLLYPCARIYAAPEDYRGRFFVTLQASGAWDVSSFCDPKENTSDKVINNWSSSGGSIRTAGNLSYAPFANNQNFFNKYYQDMLVINGIDAQTNAHTTGTLHNWSGRNSAGYPSLTALFAAVNAPQLPLAYMNFGGYAETARLIRYTRLNDIHSLLGALSPNTPTWDRTARFQAPDTLSLIQQKQQQRLNRLRAKTGLLPRKQYTMDSYYQARESTQGLEDFSAYIPESSQLEDSVVVNPEVTSSLRSQIQTALLAFKSGAGCSADLHLQGFDTHSNHDAMHEPLLAHLTDSIDYFWSYADTQGIAERVTLLIASDFSRTPYYNSSEGKDHWPIGSAIVMEKGASWGNRVIGATDDEQNALNIHPTTLATEASNGITIHPKHVHKALRDYLGIGNHALTAPFPFNNTEDIAFFLSI